MHTHKSLVFSPPKGFPLKKFSPPLAAVLAPILLLFACQTASPLLTAIPHDSFETSESALHTLIVMTHDSFAVSESVLQQFETENRVKVSILMSGDAGETLNKAILSKHAPLADVLYGVDNTFLARALKEEILQPYPSPLVEPFPAELRLDSENRALPVDYGFVCINYDTAWFASHQLALPQSLEDLTRSEYKGLLVMENPATSSPGLAFLLATVAHFGPDKFVDFWKSLRENRMEVVDSWTTAYSTNFSGSSGKGPQPMVVSYGSSPPYEMIYADPPPAEPPTASLVGPDMCFRQIEFVGILAGTSNRDLAEKFVDFMLGRSFQEDIPLQMFMFPANPQAILPDAFRKYSQIPLQPASLPPEEIANHREEWINLWKEAVLQ